MLEYLLLKKRGYFKAKKEESTYLKHWVLSSILLIIGLIVIFITFSQDKNNSISVQDDETAEWKTYSNRSDGFEFKYPSNLIINYEKDWNGFYFYKDQNSADKGGIPHEKGALFSIDVSVEDKSTYKTIREQEQEQGVPESYSHIKEYRDSQGRMWTFNGSI